MASVTRLLVILEEDSCIKLELPNGIPGSVDEVIEEIKNISGLTNEIRLQYYDADFSSWVNLTKTSDLKDLATLKVVQPPPVTLVFEPVDLSVNEANVHSQDDASISSSACSDDTLPNLNLRLEMQSIRATRSYPSDADLSEVAQALTQTHPCLKEPGSFNHSYGWKQRLKTKMYNYRTYLKSHSSSSDELTVNSVKRKSPTDAHPAKNIKKPRRAESNHYPSLPHGETPESMEQERIALLTEVKKRNNGKTIRAKMAQTFAFRRQEIVNKKASLEDIIERWPALFEVQEINAEFHRVTTIPLEARFMEKLDEKCIELIQVVRKKGGATREKTKLLPVVEKDTDIGTRREIALKCLIINMRESMDDLVQEFLVSEKEEAEHILQGATMAIYIIRDAQAAPKDIGIILEGQEVVNELPSVANAVAILMGLLYVLNMEYPKTLKQTFEYIQKVLMELDPKGMTTKVKKLYDQLYSTA
ncbi:uncharacterized protein LOC115553204 [Gadus morhua]|uniref:uncharacterized protein LOC115553204 n=2 Tax=Gadus morhua TaxID=8049 RepID=UPI0011B60745|nr:uncharacterized protein LOC115553204 [Gadus morhua]XP_059896023.1 uncharacterized protein LOC132448601 isoform X2 [Gadus macrocephalus]XP_059898836.1 uncharacterized protein LOC132450740 isoform X3 [Gadus macrocephalus]XP_059906721.1 uncharacterized protein LOC132456386 isoform X3 [Gadus macrocephalus]XP_059912223.1 uncharacterized protein LOC132461192 isoform X3 [Gadus macrocephalus]XP_059912227.1 uncharacterized protein LOC132461193 isoform X3 [Gadus macrocephalus]